MSKQINIHWFRQDLRLSDNPALTHSATNGVVMPIYILDNVNPQQYQLGGASSWWLHYSLISLQQSLSGDLSIYKGDPLAIFKRLIEQYDINSITWNRCYEPWRITRDSKIKEFLTSNGVTVYTVNGSLLWEPWEITKDDGTPYKVFTPFYRKGCLKSGAEPRKPLPVPTKLQTMLDHNANIAIDKLSLLPTRSWGDQLLKHWDIGEQAAHKRLQEFINAGLKNYKEGRDIPSLNSVSRLSPHLHFGEISPNQAWYSVLSCGDDRNIEHFCSELGWREFSYSQLYYNKNLPTKNLQSKFDNFPWENEANLLKAWQQGMTGVPMVDAGMRQLWQTGYMHNRVRMIVGSFLVKNLLLHWHHGERWFWDTLVDADLASNSASWQWVAGCGADAAPYFRIFNPVMQGQKFDANGEYVRKFIPEIAELPNKYLFNPWEAPADILAAAKVTLGKTYPLPIVDLKESRERALSALQSLKEINQ